MPVVKRLRGRLASERGYTLIELMIVMVMLVLVLIAVGAFLTTSKNVAARDSETAVVQTQTDAGYLRMIREIRQAVCINVTSGTAANCAGTAAATTGACVPSACSDPIPCPAGSTASCVSFKMRSIAASDHHRVDVRYDCSASSTCTRTSDDQGTQTTSQIIPFRQGGAPLLNGGVRAASCSTLTPPAVFTYYAQSSSAWTCTAFDGTVGSSIGRIDVTVQLPGRGERVAGHSRTLTGTSSVELRNVL